MRTRSEQNRSNGKVTAPCVDRRTVTLLSTAYSVVSDAVESLVGNDGDD